MATNVSFTKLDFDQIKSSLKTYLKAQARFRDYDFEGSNMSVLLDVLAYNTFQNNFYTNMAFTEMFLDSAQLRDSVISHAKELNYLPGSRTSSQVKLDVTLAVNDGSPSVYIPAGTRFKAVCGSETFFFVSDETVEINPTEAGVYKYTGLSVYEGEYVKELYTVSGSNANTYIISNKTVDTNSVTVRVRDNAESTANTEYTLARSLFGVAPDDNVFYIEPFADERYRVTFGLDVFGKEPINGNVVEISYRICSADAPNGTKRFSATGNIAGYVPTVVLNSESALVGSEGGSEREDLKSIKFYAPKSIQIQDRAVTESDYGILLKNRFSEIQAVSVFGGEEATPPQYGRVIVAVDVNNSDGVSENSKSKYVQYLKERSPLTIEPIVISPDFMYVSIESSVYYNRKVTTKTPSDIKALVQSAISSYNTDYLSDFRKNVRYSKLVGNIDDSDSSIISNDTKLKAIIELNPVLGMFNNISFSFANPLIIDHPLTVGENIATHTPALKSSGFVYLNSSAFLQDNGLGIIQILSTVSSGFVVLNSNVGTVNYTTGEINIKNFSVDSYTGASIKLYATLANKDILGPKQRIVTIRTEDVNVTVTGVTE